MEERIVAKVDKIDLQKFLELLSRDNTQFEEISNEVRDFVLELSMIETKKLFKASKQNDIKQVMYLVYRSYILGILFERMKIGKPKFNKVEDNVINIF
jgi:predicted nucleotidyltransferase